MILPDIYVIGLGILGLIYFLFTFWIYSQTKAYVNPRVKANVGGLKFVQEVDDNRRLNFLAVKEENGSIKGHLVISGSALRSLDGLLFQVHKDVGRTLTPEGINSSNNLYRMGFKSFAHAGEFYKKEYFREDWEKAKQEISDTPAMASVITAGVEKKIGIELMMPIQDDNFTQDLSIVANFLKAKMSPQGLINVIEKVKNEAERGHNDGFTVEKAMKWVIVLATLMCATAFALILANAAGLKLFGGTPTPQQIVEVVGNVSNMTK
jgi:hypothetical protein